MRRDFFILYNQAAGLLVILMTHPMPSGLLSLRASSWLQAVRLFSLLLWAVRSSTSLLQAVRLPDSLQPPAWFVCYWVRKNVISLAKLNRAHPPSARSNRTNATTYSRGRVSGSRYWLLDSISRSRLCSARRITLIDLHHLIAVRTCGVLYCISYWI